MADAFSDTGKASVISFVVKRNEGDRMRKNRIVKRLLALTMVFIMLFQIRIPEQVYAATKCTGAIESVTASGSEVTIKGYAYDTTYPNSWYADIYLEVGLSSKIYAGKANLINFSSPYIQHGFDCTVDLSTYLVSSGTKYIYIYAKSYSGSYSYIGYKTVYMDPYGGSSSTKTYTITYDANGGSSTPSSQAKTEGAGIFLTSSKPTRAGYKFLGWSTSSYASSPEYYGGEYYNTDADLSLYAVWEKDSVSVTASKYSVSMPAYASTSSAIQLTASAYTTLSVATDGSGWLKLRSYSTGSNSLSMKYTNVKTVNFYIYAAANTESSSRTGTLTVSDADGNTLFNISVAQEAAASSGDIEADEEPASVLNVSTTSISVNADGTLDTNRFYVNTSGTCGFTVSVPSSASWLGISNTSIYSAESGKTYLSYTKSNYNSYVYLAAQANTSTSARTAIITITSSDGKKSAQVEVKQSGSDIKPVSSLKVSTTSITVNANGTLDTNRFYVNTSGKFGFTVTVSGGAGWLGISKSSLYSVEKGASYLSYTASKNNSYVYLAAKANDSNLSRTATITITSSDGNESAQVTVKQSGMEGKLTISPVSLTLTGGTSNSKSFTVDTSKTGGFSVSVPDDANWLRISKSYMSSTSDGFKELNYEASNYKSTVYVCAEANKESDSRTATLTITHDIDPSVKKTFTVTQSGTKFSVDKSSIAFEDSLKATSSKIQITADSSIYWTAETSDSSWLKVSDYASSYGYSSESGSGNGSLYIIVSENDKYEERSGTVTISADGRDSIVISVTQAAKVKEDISIDVDVDTLNLDAKGKSELVSSYSSYPSVKVKVSDSSTYKVTTDGSDWIKVGTESYSDSYGKKSLSTTSSSFYVYAKKNASTESRTATLTITADDGAVTKTIVVEQEGVVAQLTVSETSKTVEKDGSMYNNAVYADTDGTGGIKISIPKDVDWLRLSSDSYTDFSSGMKELTFPSTTGGSYYYNESTGKYETHDYCFYFIAKKNTSNKSRTASVTITNSLDSSVKETITVTQDAAESTYLKLNRETAYFDEPKLACSAAIKVSTDDDTKWTAKASKSWIKIVKSKSTSSSTKRYSSINGTGKGTFYILVTENNSYSERTGYVTVSAPGLKTQKIYVSQVANEIDVDSLLEELTVTVTKKTFNIGNTSSIKFSYPDGLYASDIKKVTYSSNNKVVATVNSRGVIKAIKKGKATISVKVQLRKGTTKTFKLRVVIGKRKVNISQLK